MTSIPKANTFLDALMTSRSMEAQMDEFIFRNFGWVIEDENSKSQFTGIIYDDYDCSFELTGTNPEWEPTSEQMMVMFKDVGFDKCWVNYTDGNERHYWWNPTLQLAMKGTLKRKYG